MFGFRKKSKNLIQADMDHLPEHVAIIMDGNGRWAKKRGLPRSVGHSAGSDALQNLTEYCDKIGLKYLTVYAFSTENWKRPKDEVDAIMNLMRNYLKDTKKLLDKKVKIRFIGDFAPLAEDIQSQMKVVEDITKDKTGTTLIVALNYGGRDEIVSAAKKLCGQIENGELTAEDITEEVLNKNMYAPDVPDPELIIRPSGEYRLSNFLMWQSAYSEFWYSDVLWPDFKGEHLLSAIADFQKRNRRFGGV